MLDRVNQPWISYDPICKVNIMVCHSGICQLTFPVGAITKHTADTNDKNRSCLNRTSAQRMIGNFFSTVCEHTVWPFVSIYGPAPGYKQETPMQVVASAVCVLLYRCRVCFVVMHTKVRATYPSTCISTPICFHN